MTHLRAAAAGITRRVTWLQAALIATAGLLLLVAERSMRTSEASASAFVLRLTHLAGQARPAGSAVIFTQHQHWVGYSIAAGCTAALLIAPFFFVCAAVLLTRRVSLRRGLVALVAVSIMVWLVNQLRLLLIGAGMQLWGFRTGYDRTHVLAGGVLSTFGVAVGVVAFLVLMVRPQSPARRST